MSVYVSHYLVNWERFCEVWVEEEHPLDALDGAESRDTRNDILSSTYWLEEHFERVRRQLPQAEWLPALSECIHACSHRGHHRDLPDAFAYEEGGFTITMSPATAAWIASQWEALPHAEVDAAFTKSGDVDGSHVIPYIRGRMEVIAMAAASGRGYVTRVG